jgi:hypothetical protein
MRVTESVATANTQFYKSVATKDKKETKRSGLVKF